LGKLIFLGAESLRTVQFRVPCYHLLVLFFNREGDCLAARGSRRRTNSLSQRSRTDASGWSQAVYEDDGSVRIAVSHLDPGIPNWLDVGGHCVGMVNQRWVEAQDHPVPTAKLVKVADLPRLLPSNARRIGAEERREQLRRRKIGVDRRFPYSGRRRFLLLTPPGQSIL